MKISDKVQQLRALAVLAEDLGFSSQHPSGPYPLSVSTVPEDLMPSSGLHGYAHDDNLYMQAKHPYLKNIKTTNHKN